jgi:hypothetical protein
MSDKSVLAAGAGAATGGAGAIVAVSAAGVPGLAATGITSGLAVIGTPLATASTSLATVLGTSTISTMAAGLFTVAAAPVAGCAIGYGLYKWLKD